MKIRTRGLLSLWPIMALCACAQSDSIATDGAVYDAISPEASITAAGNEPFWGLEIGPAKGGRHKARFTTPEDSIGREFYVTRFAGNNGLGFSGELTGVPLQVAITPGECSDGMSDRTYPFAATVAVGETTRLGCAYTSDASYKGPEAP